ncbi:hypothetical protein [Stenotrophomonas sp. 59]|uniref:hypothetical protein n=1 Tax=Stenotrophomonas sp. 59 TaxID=3051120 RepID=UPI00256EDC8B|nr:hypothetical protein [Stenotrophomonas sp. 59]
MKLEYRMLWFDDQRSSIEPAIKRIEAIISRLGFQPHVDLRIVQAGMEDPLAGIPDEDDVDLVMMDWKLGGQHDGAKLTRRLRQKYRNTDVVFYSSETAKRLRELIFNEDIDGVYCCNRDQLGDRVSGIIQGQLRRVLDLDHMRGIVMAATSDLDHGMIECLEVIQRISYPDNKPKFAAIVSETITARMLSKIEDIRDFERKGRLDKLLRDPNFGATQRLEMLLSEIAKIGDQLSEPHLIEHLEVYQGEIISPRNDFAHRKAEKKNGKIFLQGREAHYDQEKMRELRLRLLKHSDNLGALLSMLANLAVAAGQPALAEQLTDAQAAIFSASDDAAK